MAKKLLIIDDEEDILTYLVTVFEENGYEVNTASDGKEGLKKLGHDKPDLICLDLLMPNKSGIAFYRAIRKDSSFKEIPVVILTGFNKNDYPTADMEKFIYEPSVPLPEDYLEKAHRQETASRYRQPYPDGRPGSESDRVCAVFRKNLLSDRIGVPPGRGSLLSPRARLG